MLISKITVGFVIQTFNTNTRQYTNQEFVAGDDVQYEQDGEPVDAKLMEDGDGNEPYLPFIMQQPNDHRIAVDVDHLATVVDLATQNILDDDDPDLADEISNQNAAVAAVTVALETMRSTIAMDNPSVDGESLQDIELSDGGCIEVPDDDGTIRRRDVFGNCEEVREIGDQKWKEWADLFGVTKEEFMGSH